MSALREPTDFSYPVDFVCERPSHRVFQAVHRLLQSANRGAECLLISVESLLKAKDVTGAIKKVAKSGHFWAVLRAEHPGVTAVLKTTLKTLGYSVKDHDLAAFKRAAGNVADDLLAHTSTPLMVLASEADVHSLGSSGAADLSERPPTREELLLSAYDDAASQATGSAKELRIAEANRAAELRKEAADRERQFIVDELARERQERERERHTAAERERQQADQLLAAVARAATAEARAATAEARAARCCAVM